ncbi:hypothetical protein A3A67_01820 [Candidatus Peribacteria bacterium RIFCSPLOWO2_01_FULL_51_18]|nr:MAG: hypothetical protein A3C52_03740 [Candidatus Peribacteria bacterium RIFCSPHIGHO2_02_FULL_51_15]OGJ65202.1 MAG: hypothetical protein A3A67_01820 [Candidatus Peribacteria bacterium RIFCSPLOWO2_01_FULL_51_18]OGJ67269.1 MAG: hypothetical protein A3J34_01065 [Candidatus Peribacteria bacterium RIFCSPLOWO2_02_FULL_51_10]
MEQLPKLMAIGDVRKCLGGISAQRAHDIVRKKGLRFEETSGGKIFLASDILRLRREMGTNPRSKAHQARK